MFAKQILGRAILLVGPVITAKSIDNNDKKKGNLLLLESKVLQEAFETIRGEEVYFITDETIASLYENEFQKFITIPSGEGSKTREMKSYLEDVLLESGITKKSLLVALGGGVISDLVGFTAATLFRGLPYWIIPTTLMAMVDASIGGKVHVNTPQGKNLIGTFYLPNAVIVEPKFLETLPERELRSGFMEVIKYALIWDYELFCKIEENTGSVFLERSIAIKKEIVSRDPHEKGLRRILNFGHTVAHALEALSHYELLHGEALWYGLILESYMSFQRGLLSEGELARITRVLLPYRQAKIEMDHLYEQMRFDKKATKDKPRVVLLEGIGRTCSFGGEYCTEFEREELLKAIRWYQNAL